MALLLVHPGRELLDAVDELGEGAATVSGIGVKSIPRSAAIRRSVCSTPPRRYRPPAARIGLSVAEVPRDADRLDGPGVLTAARLADMAEPGSLVVSSTVGVLLSGSGVVLEPAGVAPDGERVLRVAAV